MIDKIIIPDWNKEDWGRIHEFLETTEPKHIHLERIEFKENFETKEELIQNYGAEIIEKAQKIGEEKEAHICTVGLTFYDEKRVIATANYYFFENMINLFPPS